MKVIDTSFPDVKLLEPTVFGDERGFFLESWNRATFEAAGLPGDFVQDNHSRSARGVLRGLHFQIRRPQGKLVRVTAGEVFDVVVDIRRSSPTFGRWFGVTLSAEDKRQLWIPAGFAHGFSVLSEYADFQYKCTEYWSPEDERSIRWDDPDIGIEWPAAAGSATPRLAAKDASAPFLTDVESFL